ncbi:nicotinamide phosphoribosyltransferase domain-containing protein [Spiroplasma turonicum]|uniref:Nicotinamide phosphoribosyltransferase n=1 Tax=Spiroplasma turonicum TaxID=216946 RepID=A0A0K1P5Q9_9MOLU|nr:nicotinamide phosphoribosyltransferase domain-containing protein [Spiroplasma turonicum]AKU79643.1 putative esterase/lipase [Spiroplasma turonicum]ALX70664.1 nicotinamide phosphoribosyltransferase [Spiroplasma turonicum]
MISLFKTDSYKLDHKDQYPEKTTFLFANITTRSFKAFEKEFNIDDEKIEYIYSYGIDYTFKKLIEEWEENFFTKNWTDILDEINDLNNYTNIRYTDSMISDFEYMHTNLKKLPIDFITLEYFEKQFNKKIKVTENTPLVFIWNTNPRFYWLVGFIETWLISEIWPIITSGNVSLQFKKLAKKYSSFTCENDEHIPYQFHDFSQRGICTNYGSIKTGIGHLMNFIGSDNLPSIKELSKYLDCFINKKNKVIGTSVFATEHSVMSAGSKDKEFETYERLLDLYPTGILSIVSDTWNIFNVLEVYLPRLKDKILQRNGKLVIRPDSLNPIELIIGNNKDDDSKFESEKIGIIKFIDNLFGHKINSKGYKVLNDKIGLIFGDNISFKKAKDLLDNLTRLGYASSNVNFGIGSHNYSWSIRRDSLSIAQKVTFGKIENKNVVMQKQPYKESLKNSRKGLIKFEFTNIENDIEINIIENLSILEWKASLPNEKKELLKWLF